MKKRFKLVIALSLLLSFLFSDIATYISYGNSQKSETIKIKLNNVTVNDDKTIY